MVFLRRASNLNRIGDISRQYVQQGYSVIPIGEQQIVGISKRSAIPWKIYQRRRPTKQELIQWFHRKGYSGIAIVTGKISRLCVLDFDDISLYKDFKKYFPKLAQTHAVQTRRGIHLYYSFAQNTRIKTQHLKGIDILGEGAYVIAPPTNIHGHQYSVIQEQQPKLLAVADLKNIRSFLGQEIGSSKNLSNEKLPTFHIKSLATLYDKNVQIFQSRNHALYKTASLARKKDYSYQQVIREILERHISHPPLISHIKEMDSQRRQEGLNTIKSAFRSHPGKQGTQFGRGLPNSVREKLLDTQKGERSSAAIPRVLDAFRLEGKRDHQEFTYADALTSCRKYNIGKESLLKTLQSGLVHIASNCSGGASPEKKGRGRPERIYLMPSNADLCEALDVEDSASDSIEAADLASPAAYRKALHRLLLERGYNEMPRKWYGKRLGVSRWTIHRYHRDMDVKSTPVFAFATLSWENAASLVAPVPPQKCTKTWIMDKNGKSYPDFLPIAWKLLQQERSPLLVRQLPNRYTLPHTGEMDTRQTIWRCLHCNSPCETDQPVPDRCPHCPGKVGEPMRWFPETPINHTSAHPERCPQAHRQTLTWDNIQSVVPPDEFTDDFLVEWWNRSYVYVPQERKKYPPIRGLCYRLLRDYGSGNVTYVDKMKEGIQ